MENGTAESVKIRPLMLPELERASLKSFFKELLSELFVTLPDHV
jgi:hypothetical protein